MSNPDVILKNQYYPMGLSKESIKRYYELNKEKILDYIKTQNTPCVLFMIDDNNRLVVKRKIKDNLIYINNENYENTFNGRVISAATELKPKTKKVIIDIDCKNINIPEPEKTKVLSKCLDILKTMHSEKFIHSKIPKIFLTSSGYHVHIVYYKDMTPPELGAIFDVKFKDLNTDNIKFDFSIMRNRGSYTIPWCLNRNGLICAEITKNWKTVKRSNYKILY